MATNPSQSPPGPDVPGLPESIRLWLASASGYVHARLSLIGLEAGDALSNYVKIIILLVTAVLMLVSSYFFLVIALAFGIAWLVHGNWGWVLVGLGVLQWVAARMCGLFAKGRFSESSYPATGDEFKKDKEWLNRTKSTNRSQNLSVVRTS